MWNLTAPAPSADSVDALHDVIFDLLHPSDRSGIPTAVDHAYEMIWRQLIRGEREPGHRLTDTELAAQLGLSRTPVRQALHRLAQEDLVRLDARRGFSVREFSANDVIEIYQVRAALEVLALRLAAPHLTSKQIQDQLDALHRVRAALRTERDDHSVLLHLEADLKFHNLLIQTSGNGRLIRILAGLRSQQTLFQYWDTSYPERNEAAADEHEIILISLVRGDTAQAETSLEQHIVNARSRVLLDLFGLDGESHDLADQQKQQSLPGSSADPVGTTTK
jgi:DNA-binding GntR family transcriptional regulator